MWNVCIHNAKLAMEKLGKTFACIKVEFRFVREMDLNVCVCALARIASNVFVKRNE